MSTFYEDEDFEDDEDEFVSFSAESVSFPTMLLETSPLTEYLSPNLNTNCSGDSDNSYQYSFHATCVKKGKITVDRLPTINCLNDFSVSYEVRDRLLPLIEKSELRFDRIVRVILPWFYFSNFSEHETLEKIEEMRLKHVPSRMKAKNSRFLANRTPDQTQYERDVIDFKKKNKLNLGGVFVVHTSRESSFLFSPSMGRLL